MTLEPDLPVLSEDPLLRALREVQEVMRRLIDLEPGSDPLSDRDALSEIFGIVDDEGLNAEMDLREKPH